MDSLHYFTMKPSKLASEQAGRLGCGKRDAWRREAVKRKSKGRTDEGVSFSASPLLRIPASPHPRFALLPASSASVIFQYFLLCFLVGGGQVESFFVETGGIFCVACVFIG
jgi:hypothetical protein